MTSIRDFLTKDPLAVADIELRRKESLTRFSRYLPEDAENIWHIILNRFVHSPPWRYWDDGTVEMSLGVLEDSIDRTTSAINAWSGQLDIGFNNLFRRAPASDYEETIGGDQGGGLLRLSTEFHPEYLRCAEHIFGKLLTLYWGVLRRGSVKGKFELRRAVDQIRDKGRAFLLSGYDDRIRNAIAHGEIVFKGRGFIQYGPEDANYELSSIEFLEKFDSLWRTSNALAIALLLFIARNKRQLSNGQGLTLPPSIITLIAAAGVERPHLEVQGVVESDLASSEKQLHVGIRTAFRSRLMALADSARLAMHLIDHGATGYARFLFEIDHGEPVLSLAIISPQKLSELLEQGASFDRFNEIFDETQLLWYHESVLRSRLRAWKLIIESQLQLAKERVHDEWSRIGFRRGAGRYRIRKIENRSAEGIPRINVTAVLRHPSDADDREMINEICWSIIRRVSWRWIKTNPSSLDRKWGRLARPKYVWVNLYKIDGTLRWLASGGWLGGNLLAVAEKIKGFGRPPIYVPNPEDTWRGIRFRYSMDMEAASEAIGRLVELVDEIGPHGVQDIDSLD